MGINPKFLADTKALPRESQALLDAANIIRTHGHAKDRLEADGRYCLMGAINMALTGRFTYPRPSLRDFKDETPAAFWEPAVKKVTAQIGKDYPEWVGHDPWDWNNAQEKSAQPKRLSPSLRRRHCHDPFLFPGLPVCSGLQPRGQAGSQASPKEAHP